MAAQSNGNLGPEALSKLVTNPGSKLLVNPMRLICSEIGISKSGNKSELQLRLINREFTLSAILFVIHQY